MARKKIVLFIVEGINDKICLEGVLEKIVESREVRFQITEGDITTRSGMDEFKIRNEIGKIVKAFKDRYHLKPEHFMEVIHIIDTDGLYLREDSIYHADVVKNVYEDDGIYTKDVEGTLERNLRKSAIVERMLAIPKVLKTIPYSVYYFSSNMDHVLHNNANLSNEEKDDLANAFDEKYSDEPEEFLLLMNEESFAVKGTYEETWNFIKIDKNSVQRYSNFGVYLSLYASS